jgi:hypothetical protein
MDKLVLILLGVFLLLFGIAHATNVEIVWMDPICALSALVAGAVCLFRALR